MSDISDVKLYCAEAQKIILHAEETRELLTQHGSCEGRHLIAAHLIVSLRRLSNIIERHHDNLAFEGISNAINPPALIKRHWWSNLHR